MLKGWSKMSTERTAAPVPGISSRRFACDRCRVQKARCLREHADQTRCDRCIRADADCVTSPMSRRRSWQIIAYDSPNVPMLGDGTKKRQRRGQQEEDLTTPSESSGTFGTQFANSSHSGSPFYSDQSAALTNPSNILPRTLPESSAQHAAGNVLGFEGIFSQPAETSLEYIQGSLGLSDDFFMPEALSAAQPGPHIPSGLSRDYLNPIRAAGPHIADPSSTSNEPTPESGLDETPDSRTSGETPQQDAGSPLQQLSRLDYELVTLLTVLDKGRTHVTMDTLISPIDESKSSKPAVDEILNRTREFVDVLEAFSGPASSAAPRMSQNSFKHRSYPADTSRGSVEMDHDTPSDSSSQSLTSGSSSPSSFLGNSDSQPTAVLDSTSLLAILTVYIRVLRLHLVIFANVYDLLKETSESDDRVLCPVPGLNFSSFPIQSGNLQTIILIQIVTSLFERLEPLLGLPREFRIGDRDSEAPGLFGQQGFMKTAVSIIGNEEAGASDRGKGGVKALRWHIKKAKQLLKESIAP
ncbi:hypothetical protein KVR01_004451 [Diaporthe batatas]|uniref:uncharacterized protein n=1 Tax=Diaporthe batatas TaxID=748121 RepID=UPI001D05489C|nr:uncharacterized protein KVR01_004451 [Diaporthe batatas]KAG8165899.1 hypothetical protein KVR01_004451 [Diaporthe batatas]